MEAVDKVSAEVDKVITKFGAISEHASKVLSAEQTSLELLKATLLERKLWYRLLTCIDANEPSLSEPPDSQLTPQQVSMIKSSLSRTKEKLQRLCSEHRDLHVKAQIFFWFRVWYQNSHTGNRVKGRQSYR